jgi:hypothetical protein
MVEPQNIIFVFEGYDASVYPSTDDARRALEVIDVRAGIFEAFSGCGANLRVVVSNTTNGCDEEISFILSEPTSESRQQLIDRINESLSASNAPRLFRVDQLGDAVRYMVDRRGFAR